MFLILTVDNAERHSSRPAPLPPGKASSTRWRALYTAEKQNILASAKFKCISSLPNTQQETNVPML